MGGEWMNAWEVEKEAAQDRRNAMIESDRPDPSEYIEAPVDGPDWDDRDAERASLDELPEHMSITAPDDWYARKYGPDEADIAFEKARVRQEAWLDDEPSDEELEELEDSGEVEDLLVDLDREDRHDNR